MWIRSTTELEHFMRIIYFCFNSLMIPNAFLGRICSVSTLSDFNIHWTCKKSVICYVQINLSTCSIDWSIFLGSLTHFTKYNAIISSQDFNITRYCTWWDVFYFFYKRHRQTKHLFCLVFLYDWDRWMLPNC